MSESSIVIREANPHEAWEIRHVIQETWIDTYPSEEHGITREDIVAHWTGKSLEEEDERLKKHEERIRNDEHTHTFVAEDHGRIVGVLIVEKGEERNQIGAFYVIPAYQRRGIGKQLLEKGLEWLGGEKQVYLQTVVYNHKALNFYKKLGFEENGPTTSRHAKLSNGKEFPLMEMILN